MEYWLIIGQTSVSILVCLGSMFLLWRKVLAPVINERMGELHEAIELATKVTKGSMTVLSDAGVQAREMKSMEDDLFQAVLDQYPEIEAMAQMVAPDFLEKIKENPQSGLALLERWGPYLEKFGVKTPGTQSKVEYQF